MNSSIATRTSLRDFLQIIFKWKRWMLLFFGISVIAAVVVSLLIRPTFEATSQLLVKIGRENLYHPAVPMSDRDVDREEYINSEIQILKSRSLAEGVLLALGPSVMEGTSFEEKLTRLGDLPRPAHAGMIAMDQAIASFQDALEIERVKKSSVIRVRFKHHDPQMAANTVNMLCEQYLERHLNVHSNSQSFKFFQVQSEVLERSLKTTEQKLRRFKSSHNISSLNEERSMLLNRTNALHAELNNSISLAAETEMRIDQLKRQLASIPETVLRGKEVDHNPYIISNLQSRLVDLELKKRDLLTQYTENSRFVRNIDDEIRIVKDKLVVQESKRFGKSIFGLNVNYQRIQDTLLSNQAEFEALRARMRTQRSQIAAYRERIEKMNSVEAEIAQLQSKLEGDRQNYQLYLSKFEESRISKAMAKEKIVSVNMVESAKPPIKPLYPKVSLNLILAAFIGVFGGLSIAFWPNISMTASKKPKIWNTI